MPTPAVTITGTLSDLTGSPNIGSVRFDLQNIPAGTVPTISGTSLIAKISQTVVPNGSGVFTVTLWGNYQLTNTSTYYSVAFLNNQNAQVAVVPYQFNTAGTFDISSLQPLTSNPSNPAPPNAVITNPTGIQTIGGFGLNVPSLGIGLTQITSNATVPRTLALPDSAAVIPASVPVQQHQFLTGLDGSGNFSQARPAAADLSDGTIGSGAVVLAGSPTITGTLSCSAIKQVSPNSFVIADPLGVSHFFISNSSPYTNTFVNGNGSGAVFLGSAALCNVADTTGNITTSGTITSTNTSGFAIGSVSSTPRIVFTSGNTGFEYTFLTGSNAIAGVQIASVDAFETAGLAGLAGHGRLLADATSHFWKANNNNGTSYNLVGDTTTQTLTNKTFETINNTFTINGTAVSTGVPRTALDSTGKGWQFIGTATGATVTVGPVTTTGTFQQFMVKYQIKGYNGGTPVGRFLCGNTTPSTTALTNSFSISEGVTAPTTGAGGTAIPGLPLAVTLSNTQRAGTIFIDGTSGSVKVIDVIGNEQSPSVATAPTLFRGASFFSDLGTNLTLKQFQLTVYDTLTAVAASAQTFVSGTYLTVWGRNND